MEKWILHERRALNSTQLKLSVKQILPSKLQLYLWRRDPLTSFGLLGNYVALKMNSNVQGSDTAEKEVEDFQFKASHVVSSLWWGVILGSQTARIIKHNAYIVRTFWFPLRSPKPFGGAIASKRVIPVIGFEAVESQNLPRVALDRMCRRPNFNRAPKGWGTDYNPESNELWK